jgi:putative flippase GtrA
MTGFWWRLPVMRGLSPFARGILGAVATTLGCSLLSFFGLNQLFPEPDQTSASLAQIGATLLVAYAVQMSWVLKASRKRGSDRENWVGVTTGVGSCALLGIVVSLALAGHHESYNRLEAFAFGWAVVSSALLGIWIAFQPWAMYHWTHVFNTEYPDE